VAYSPRATCGVISSGISCTLTGTLGTKGGRCGSENGAGL
jgi:hypothetical protein